MNIATRSATKEILSKYGIKAYKPLGQNFLTDPHVLGKIVKAAQISKADAVLEIGSGIGGLTQALAENAGHVCAVEMDFKLAAVLSETMKAYSNIDIITGDILEYDIASYMESRKNFNHKVVANLPYYITTPIVMKLLENFTFKSLTVMVQKEVARRMVSGVGNKSYGALSLAVQYHGAAEIAAYVPENSFFPRPTVGSAVVHIDVYEAPIVKADKISLFKNIRAGFGQRRKILVNSLFGAELYPLAKEELDGLITSCGLKSNVRAEELNLDDWAKLTEELLKKGAEI